MKDFILSLLSVTVTGTLIAAVFPDGEMKKPLTFLCGAVVASVFFTLVISAITALTTGKMPILPETPDVDFSDVFEKTVSDAVSDALSSENRPVFVSYADGIFTVEKIEEITESPTGSDVMIHEGDE